MNPLRTLIDCFEGERARWAYWLPVAGAVGISLYFALPFEPQAAWLMAAPVLAGAAWAVRLRSWPLCVFLFTLFVAATGFDAALIETRLDARPMLTGSGAPQPVTGQVVATDIMPDGLRLTLAQPHIGDLAAAETPEKIRLKIKDLTFDDAPPTGAIVSLFGQVNGFSEPVAPHGTDFRWQAFYKHLGGLGWTYGKVTIIDPAPAATSFRQAAGLALERARKTLARHVYDRLSGDVAAMTATRLNGEQTAISEPVIEAMRIAGLAHLLSTSGFHVTIMALLIFFPLRLLMALIPPLALRYPIKKIAAGAAIFSALGYTFLVGSQAATLRSMAMTGLAMLAITLDRRTQPLRLVMVSAGLAMLFAPDATLGPSFQMSFAAVFCLIACQPRHRDDKAELSAAWYEALPPVASGFIGHMNAIIRTSLIATAATTPFSIYHFQAFSLYGFIANMAALPITSFWVMPNILLAYLTAPLGCDGWFIDAAGVGVAVTIRIATTVAAWPYSIFYWPAMPTTAFIVIILGGLWFCLWQQRWRYAGLVLVGLGLMYPLYTTVPDLFIAPDGKAWAVRLQDGRLAASNVKKYKFAVEQWQQRLGMPAAIDAAALPPDHPELRCDDAGCVYRHDGNVIALPATEPAVAEDCAHATWVITPVMVRGCAAKTIDEQALSRHGAHSLRFAKGVIEIDTARAASGLRPWNAGWATQANTDEPEE